MYRWIGGAILGAVVLAVMISGCGGDDEASASLTKAEYVKQANEICAERKKKWDSALASYRKEAKEKNAANNVKLQQKLAEGVLEESMLPALQQELEALESLGAPEGKEKQTEKMLKARSKAVEGIEKDGVQAVAETPFADLEEEAKDLGVKCPL